MIDLNYAKTMSMRENMQQLDSPSNLGRSGTLVIPSTNLGKSATYNNFAPVVPVTRNEELVVSRNLQGRNSSGLANGARNSSLLNKSGYSNKSLTSAVYNATSDNAVENRSDLYMNELFKKDIIVTKRLYLNEKPSYLLAKTKLGDNVFIKLDNEMYVNSFPQISDVEEYLDQSRKDLVYLKPTTNAIEVGQETMLNSKECENFDICGAALTCNNGICFANKKENTAVHFNEIMDITNVGVPVGAIGYNALEYPIITMSSALNNPDIVNQVNKYSTKLRENAFKKLEDARKVYGENLKKMQEQYKTLGDFEAKLKNNLSGDITKLTKISGNYDANQAVNVATNQKDIVYSSLMTKNEIMNQSIAALSNYYAQAPILNGMNAETKSRFPALIDELSSSLGYAESKSSLTKSLTDLKSSMSSLTTK